MTLHTNKPRPRDLLGPLDPHEGGAASGLTEESLRWRTAFFEAQLESSPDGILVVDSLGTKIQQNRRLAEIWKIPREIAEANDDAAQLAFVTSRTKNPRQFVEKVKYLYSHPSEISSDEVELVDGTILDRDSSPVYDKNGTHYGRIWTFRDITERRKSEHALLESRRFLQSTVDALSAHIAILDDTGTIIAVNAVWKQFAEKNQYTGVDFGIGSNYLQVTEHATGNFSAEAPQVAEGIRSVIARVRDEVLIEYPCHGPTESRWFVVRVTRFNGDGPVRVVVAHENITSRKQAEESLQASEERWNFALEGSGDGVWDWNLLTNEIVFSRRWKEMLGYSDNEPINTLDRWKTLVHVDDLPRALVDVQAQLDGRTATYVSEYRMRCADGNWKWFLARGMVVRRDSHGKPLRMVGTNTDISERKAMEEELRSAARVDKLTGLPNRALLLDRLQIVIAQHKRFNEMKYAVLFLDFDRFKMVNDSLGHEAGDQLLQEIARRLATAVRGVDSVSHEANTSSASRLGGDEFVVLLGHLHSEADAAIVAERILDTLSAPYKLGIHEIVSTASIGIVTSEYGHDRAEDVLRDADTAMYEAKVAGKGRAAIFNESMRVRVQRKVNLESGIRKALDAGQFVLHYQPIVSLESGRVEGFEALVRWQHPQHGMISPGEFIPVAEETGLIVPLGEWVFREACRQISIWWSLLGRGSVPSISINLSRAQLSLHNLPQKLHDIAIQAGVDPSAIHLEVTESAIMADARQAAKVLHQIKDLGFTVYMDDFGTGYSSLSSLHQFPIDVLKIDRSFIANLSRGSEFAALVTAIVMLARNLHITVIAEGVETGEQVCVLQSLDCQSAQGYFFARPMAAEQVPAYLAKQVLPAA
jgi:diguanylate cyclase (GGDEF)-like protein/PAS domain S-box-containing protein